MNEIKILPIRDPQCPPAVKINPVHIKGALKLGRIIMPGNSDFPSFSSVHPDKYINRMVDYMYEDDRDALLIILRILAYSPAFIIRGLMHLIETGSKWGGMLGAPFRMLSIALKGLVFTIYYSDMTKDKAIFKKIGWDAKIVG